MRKPRRPRPPQVLEKVEQAHIVQLFEWLGGKVYVLGTRRRKGDYPGTMQTPGVSDLLAFLPRVRDPLGYSRERLGRRRLVLVECKARDGRMSDEQEEFRELALAAEIDHIVGGLDAVIAWLIETGYARSDQFAHYRLPATPARRPACRV